jgi:hypothetical protein
VLPEDISLMRQSYSQYPDDDECLYFSMINLNKQIANNYSKKILECNLILKEYSIFLNKLCEVAESSKVEYISETGQNKLVFIEQLCCHFFNEILLGHFQPILLD